MHHPALCSARPRPGPQLGARRTVGVRGALLWPALLAAVLGAACASYPERTREALDAFQGGRLERAEELYADPKWTKSTFLTGAEAGTVALAAGEWARAREHLERAAAAVRDFEDRALISPDSAAEQLGGLLINESQLPYRGEGYERVLLHALLAKTYLAEGNLEGVWVEARRANRLLGSEETLYETQYRAGGLAHFLSALVYELLDEPDNALIDYRRMLEKGVGEELAGRAALRLAERLGRLGDFPEWTERFGPPAPAPEGAASVVLVAGLGLAPKKREASITLPTPWGIARFAVPELVDSAFAPPGLVLELAEAGLSVQSTEVENVDEVMRKNLSDRIGWLALRSAGRAALKLTAREKLREEMGIGGAILGDLFTLATERADLRSWTTLPASFHAARALVPAGWHRVTLQGSAAAVDLGTFELLPGETLFLLARSVGTRLYAYPIGGGAVPHIESEPGLLAPRAAAADTIPEEAP